MGLDGLLELVVDERCGAGRLVWYSPDLSKGVGRVQRLDAPLLPGGGVSEFEVNDFTKFLVLGNGRGISSWRGSIKQARL